MGTDGNGESQAHLHPTRIILEPLLHKVAQLGKVDNFIIHCLHLVVAKAEQCTVEKDILAASELWVKANAQLNKRHQRATYLDTSAIGGVDAGNRLE